MRTRRLTPAERAERGFQVLLGILLAATVLTTVWAVLEAMAR